ncbi:MAG: 2-hydroxyglutaryl-CoA dehydratase [Dehalococcoidia bacterium]|nr:2-hydroxyglutaryl-CoA dehydratase [Dehalococcoidia bacterium]
MAWFMGIDIGSVTTKGVIASDGILECHHLIPSGFNYGAAGQRLRQELLAKADMSEGDITGIVATGSGAGNLDFGGRQASEIVCCARGMAAIFPDVRTIISVGGQGSQVIRMSDSGKLADFAVSERCASGSARFLQVMANVLRIDIDEIGPLSLKSTQPVTFSTGCAVFGETEAITRIAEGFSMADILAGVHQSLANKIASLVAGVGLQEKCALCGGGGLDVGLVKSLEDKLGFPLLVPSHPQIVTALGAAVLAQEKQ